MPRLGYQQLVLLFNETNSPQSVVLQNKDLTPGQDATMFGTSSPRDSPTEMHVTIPAKHVAAMHIK